jgi:hypothetical protein
MGSAALVLLVAIPIFCLVLGAVVHVRDMKRGRRSRRAGDMWVDDVREHRRDAHAVARLVQRPQWGWTRWARRSRGERH